MAYDGSIKLGIKIDTKGMELDIQKLANKYKAATAEVEKQTAKVDELKKHLNEFESGNAKIGDKGAIRLQKELDKATESAKQTQAEINALYNQLDTLQANAMKAPDTGEPMLSSAEQAQFENTNAKLDELETKLSSSRKKADELGMALKDSIGAATQAETSRTVAQLSEAETKLEGVKIKAEEAGENLKNGMTKSQTATSAASAAFEKLGGRLLSMAKKVFVFSIITKALRGVRTAITAAISSDNELQSSLNRLKAAFWTAFVPINNFVIPILKKFINWTTEAVMAVTKLFAKLSGKSFGDMINQGKDLSAKAKTSDGSNKIQKSPEEQEIENKIKAIEKENKALEKQRKAKQKAQKQDDKANKRSLADFDELSILSEDKDDEELDALDDEIDKNNEIIDQLQEQLDLVKEQQEVRKADEGVTAADFDSLGYSEGVETMLTTIMKAAGAALVAVGLILLFTGNIVWGIGFIIAGASAFGVAEAAESSGQSITDVITNFFTENAALITGLSIALLVIGIVMCCFGVVTPLSIGMIVAGAAGLVTEATLNWSYIKDTITTFFTDNAALVTVISTALLVLGVILCVTGVGIPLGIGMIVAGAAGLVTEATLNWSFLTDKIKEIWEAIKDYWNTNIAKYFTAAWWGKLFAEMCNGAISIFEKFLNFITSGIRGILNSLSKLTNAAGQVLGLNISIPQIEEISLPRLDVPGLAEGAVIPPNREFLAVLGDQKSGTNIEAPLSTIKQAVSEVMASMGGSGGSQTVVLELDGRELGRTNIRQNSREFSRTGVSLLT